MPHSTAKSIIPPHCIYNIFGLSDSSSQDYLSTYFDGAITPLEDAYTGTPQLEQIFNSSYVNFDSISTTFANIAEAMTVHVRQSGVDMSNFSAGAPELVLQEQTCVQVRWPWLAFPAALVVMTAVSFLSVLVRRTPGQMQTSGWKSSLLPLVFHGLGDGEAAGWQEITEMEEKAKEMLVHLGPTEKGWGFTRV